MQADQPLQGKVIIVTGASRGIGRRMAYTLLEAGAQVAVLARASTELAKVVSELGSDVFGCVCDVTNSAQVDAAVTETVRRFGRLDALVNNAGTGMPLPVGEFTDEQLQQQIQTNLVGPILCTRAALPHLRKQGGNIVNVSSETVRFGFPFLTVYAATKAALETFSQGLRAELAQDKIRVTVLRLGNSSAESTFGKGWSPQMVQRFVAAMRETGYAALSGPAMSAAPAAQALLGVLLMPNECNVDLIEVRSI